MKVLTLISDTSACWRYRILQPFKELIKFGVENTSYCFIPSDPTKNQEAMFLDMVKEFDLVIIQRCYLYELGMFVVQLCKFLGKPVIFEQDDDYLNLQPSNPAYYSIVSNQPLFKQFFSMQVQANELAKEGKIDEAQKIMENAKVVQAELDKCRQQGLWGYTQILREVDWVTVSTKELGRTIYPYNKNVVVFENNIESVYPWRDSFPLEDCLIPVDPEKNMYRIDINQHAQLGLYRIPNYRTIEKPDKSKEFISLPRVGYSTSPSHKYEDFYSIKDGLNRLNKKLTNQFLLTFLGDDPKSPWYEAHMEHRSNVFTLPPAQHEIYNFNLRNLDIALCPLAPNIFNMSKSDLKLVEAGSWGIPGLAPRFITYSRNWIDGENCLMYSNEDEFVDQAERLIKSKSLRDTLGANALEYVKNFRKESLHAERRYEFYKAVINNKKPLEVFAK